MTGLNKGLPTESYRVDLPAGGHLDLNDAEEVALWQQSGDRYVSDYGLTKANDLVLLGAILSQIISLYRAQRELADPKLASAAQGKITKAADQIREIEKALGIDKRSREAGGQHTVANYLTNLKRAAHARGVHIAERTKAYELFCTELKWKLRLMRNGDVEDRAYHNLTEKSVCEWAQNELAKLEEADKDWAHQQGHVFVGRA